MASASPRAEILPAENKKRRGVDYNIVTRYAHANELLFWGTRVVISRQKVMYEGLLLELLIETL